jgi:hypothetical protein
MPGQVEMLPSSEADGITSAHVENTCAAEDGRQLRKRFPSEQERDHTNLFPEILVSYPPSPSSSLRKAVRPKVSRRTWMLG